MKKYIILFFAVGLINACLVAQTFTTVPNDTVIANLSNNTTVQYKIQQVNNTGDTLSLDIEVVKNTLPTGWDGMVCLSGVCLGHIPVVGFTASQTDLINPTDTGYVRLTANPLSLGGGGELRIYVYDVDFPLAGDTLTWIINPAATGVQEVNNLFEAKIFPNPSASIVTIVSKNMIENVELYSLTGKLVRTVKDVNSNELKINVEQLTAGIYVVKINGESNNFSTQKLIVN